MKKHKRHLFFIDPETQLRWGIFAGTLGLMGCFLIIAVICVAPVLMEALSQIRTLATMQVLDLMQQLWPWLLATALFTFVTSFILGVVFSHRLFGPIYRLEKLLKERVCGQALGRIKLRQGDLLGDFMNQVTDRVDRWAEIERAAVAIVDNSRKQGLSEDQREAQFEKLREALQPTLTLPQNSAN
jgi:hypothetical protein